MHKAFKACTAVLLALVMTVSLVNGALAAVVRNDDDTISYEPLEQGRVFTPRAATPSTRSPTPRWVPERWTVS